MSHLNCVQHWTSENKSWIELEILTPDCREYEPNISYYPVLKTNLVEASMKLKWAEKSFNDKYYGKFPTKLVKKNCELI